jgi:hypothetical protein
MCERNNRMNNTRINEMYQDYFTDQFSYLRKKIVSKIIT